MFEEASWTLKIKARGWYPIGLSDGVPSLGRTKNRFNFDFGCSCGSWAILGASWAVLGSSWGRLGVSWGASWRHLGASGGASGGRSESFLGRLLSVLETSWSILAANLSHVILDSIFKRICVHSCLRKANSEL